MKRLSMEQLDELTPNQVQALIRKLAIRSYASLTDTERMHLFELREYNKRQQNARCQLDFEEQEQRDRLEQLTSKKEEA